MKLTYRAGFGWVIAALCCIATGGCGDSDSGAGNASTTSGVFVYWDENEEQDTLTPSGRVEQLIPPWDPNGQMCILRDGSGRFAVGYNPTLPGQHNPGSIKPVKNPPV